MACASTVINGILKLDGTIELEKTPQLPPGPVRVILEAIPKENKNERLIDPPWLDENIPAPFDLPHLGESKRIQPRKAKRRLPEPFVWNPEEDYNLRGNQPKRSAFAGRHN